MLLVIKVLAILSILTLGFITFSAFKSKSYKSIAFGSLLFVIEVVAIAYLTLNNLVIILAM